MRHAKKQKGVIHTPEKQNKTKQTTGTNFEGAQMMDLANRDFKAAIINMCKELKETMFGPVLWAEADERKV